MADITDETVTIAGRTIAVGYSIKVLPTAGNKTSFIGRIRGWWIDNGEVVTIDVWGGRPGKEKMRSLRLDQVEILSTRMQNKLQRARTS
jgi:hypothetical protein